MFSSLRCPKTIENFVTHCRNGYYNGHIFHRIIKQFMLQTGDPQGRNLNTHHSYIILFSWEKAYNHQQEKNLIIFWLIFHNQLKLFVAKN